MYSIMRNNLQNLSDTELMYVGAAYGVGLYFSQALATASGYACPAHEFESAAIFVLEAAGGLSTYVKESPTICTSLFPKPLHAECLRQTGRRTPHARAVVRGVLLKQGESGVPSMSTDDRSFFERAQAAYAEAVFGGGGHADAQRLDKIVAPSMDVKCSAAQP